MNRFIYMLFMVLLFITNNSLSIYAQREGSIVNNKNALDYRFQKGDRTLPRFPEGYPLRSRIYTLASAGVEISWEESNNLNRIKSGLVTHLGLGYMFSPVHAIEANFTYGNTSVNAFNNKSDYIGMDLNYVMNLSSFGMRNSLFKRFETFFTLGGSYRYSLNTNQSHGGVNLGMRFQYNASLNMGVFIEPRISVLIAQNNAFKFATMPAINAGMLFRFNKARYFIWDNITPIAIKTNLLYDVATAINFEVEVPIRERWSVCAEWMFPWWSNYNKQKYFQILSGVLEGKYWLGNRDNKELLAGWFLGAYFGAGLYDIMFKAEKGSQGEFIYTGIGAGYSHRIAKNLSLEYYLGVGYFNRDFRKYYWDDFDYTFNFPSPQYYIQSMVLPRIKVSLVWLIKIRSKRGRGYDA